LLALSLAGCGGPEAPQYRIIDVKMVPLSIGDELICVEYHFEVGLPFGGQYASILLSRRLIECRLRKRNSVEDPA